MKHAAALILAALLPLAATTCGDGTDTDLCDCDPLYPDCPASPVPCGPNKPAPNPSGSSSAR